ncbi:MAG: hypothetical protein AAF288_02335 [Planctomycetota bacterium]
MKDFRPAFVSLLVLFILVLVTLAPDATPADGPTHANAAPGEVSPSAESAEPAHADYDGALSLVQDYLDAARTGVAPEFVQAHFDLQGMAGRAFTGLPKGPSPRLAERFGGYLAYVLSDPRAQKALRQAEVGDLQAGPFRDNLTGETTLAQVTFTVQPEGVEEPVLNRVLLIQTDAGAWRLVDLGVKTRLMSREVYRGWRESRLPAIDYLDVLQREAEAAREGRRAAF